MCHGHLFFLTYSLKITKSQRLFKQCHQICLKAATLSFLKSKAVPAQPIIKIL